MRGGKNAFISFSPHLNTMGNHNTEFLEVGRYTEEGTTNGRRKNGENGKETEGVK